VRLNCAVMVLVLSLLLRVVRGMVCRMRPFAGFMRTSVWFLPAAASSRPSGLRASAWGRIPGNLTWRPAGVSTWPVGVW